MRDAANYQARLLMAYLFFIVLVPFALVSRLFSDPFDLRKRPGGSYWGRKHSADKTVAQARRQFS